MTAQEKAKEIFDKAKYLSHYEGATPWEISYLIIDEVLDVVNGIYDYDAEVLIPYWEEVKKEIEVM